MPDNKYMATDNTQKRLEAKRLYLEEYLQPAQIAERLGVLAGTVRGWKHKDNWNAGTPKRSAQNHARETKPGCRPPFQPKNQKATLHGLFARYLPDETRDIVQQMQERSPLDVLWDQIQLAYAALIRAQQIMHVRDREDVTETKVGFTDGANSDSERWEVQQAWDKHASFLNAQAKAQAALTRMLQQYDELCRSELATEEQKARIASINLEMEIARERMALEQRKAGLGDDIESESGIAYLPGVDDSLLVGAIPDPGDSI